MARKTFDQATRDVITNATLGHLVRENIATEKSVARSIKELNFAINQVFADYVSDLNTLTGHSIQWAHYRITSLNPAQQASPELAAKFAWDNFLIQYPKFIDNFIQFTANGFVIRQLRWRKGRIKAETVYNSNIYEITLDEPEVWDGKKPIRREIAKKLALFKNTIYDYEPYIITDKANSLIVGKLGCQWKDFVVPTPEKPKVSRKPLVECIVTGLIFLGMAFGVQFIPLEFLPGWLELTGKIILWVFLAMLSAINVVVFLTNKD